MKTFDDCLNKIAKRYGYLNWYRLRCVLDEEEREEFLLKAAELYGRYCRFVGRSQKEKELTKIATGQRDSNSISIINKDGSFGHLFHLGRGNVSEGRFFFELGNEVEWPTEPIESETLANGTIRWKLPQEKQRKEPQTDFPDDLFLLTQ